MLSLELELERGDVCIKAWHANESGGINKEEGEKQAEEKPSDFIHTYK